MSANKKSRTQRLQDLKLQQINGEEFKTVEPNRIKALKDPYFKEHLKEKYPSGYKVNEHEADYYHIIVEARVFATDSGVKLSTAKVDMIGKHLLKGMIDNGAFRGKKVEILHDPNRESIEIKDEKPDQGTTDVNPNDEPTEQKPIKEMTVEELRAYIEAVSGDAPDSKMKKPELLESAEYHEAVKNYIEKFETEPAEDMTTAEIILEIGSKE